MTRKKKSRKPGLAPTSASKEDKNKLAPSHDKKPKKRTGKKPGTRQLEATGKHKPAHQSADKKDPRIGSKKPIVLTKDSQPTKAGAKKAKNQPAQAAVASIKVIDNNQALEQELYAIEDDPQLQDIIAKQESNAALSNEEVDYFNEKMERHQTISELLGWDTEEQEPSQSQSQNQSDDELWDKLDSNPFADHE